ncbi:MAG: ThiF family adenylyltransferase [Acidobacteria bacterium]|nr:ThiF family adenylyltransferase [Acidobacteriota bacterium]
MEDWLAEFDAPISASALRDAQATALVEFVRRYAAAVATFVEARRRGDHELVVVDLRTGAPQAPVHPIRPTERVGILFVRAGAMPLVAMLREDFPDTEKQLLVPVGCPAFICIDDRPWAEALLTWTPAELINRMLMWFLRAARGELHDARQPLEPILLGSQLSFIVARSILATDAAEDLIAEHDLERGTILRVKPLTEIQGITKGSEPICIATYRVQPERMQRLRHAPATLAELAEMLHARGIDICADLTSRFAKWLADGELAAWRLNARFAVIVEMPITNPLGEHQQGVDLRAFLATQSAGDIAVAMGVAFNTNPQHGSSVGYAKRIGQPLVDRSALHAICVQSAEVHLEFERDLATRLAGRAEPDTRRVVLIGAGAIGSHLADCLIREGRFRWTIVDDDRLLPHNLARHVARIDQTCRHKAAILADYLNMSLAGGDDVAQPVSASLFAPGKVGSEIATALDEADLLIDATASVRAARYLSDHAAEARRLSTFFNPSGKAAVLLAEPTGRALTLRDLEAQYLGFVLRSPRLANHLGEVPEVLAYTGACRAITNRIPQWRVSVLAGLAAGGVSEAVDRTEPAILIWTLTSNDEVTFDTVPVEPVSRYCAHGWHIAVDAGLASRIHEMRTARLPSETGGILFGLVDIPHKSIHVVHASPAPPDSEERSDSFLRGTDGIEELLEAADRTTAGQVRYVGEWHSHPPRTRAHPSPVDACQIDWLAGLLGMDSMPALLLIAADTGIALVFAHEPAQRLTS